MIYKLVSNFEHVVLVLVIESIINCSFVFNIVVVVVVVVVDCQGAYSLERLGSSF